MIYDEFESFWDYIFVVGYGLGMAAFTFFIITFFIIDAALLDHEPPAPTPYICHTHNALK